MRELLTADYNPFFFPPPPLCLRWYGMVRYIDSVPVRRQQEGATTVPGHIERNGAGNGQDGPKASGLRHMAGSNDGRPVLH